MKKAINACYRCGAKVRDAVVMKDGVRLNCLKCPKCREEYFTSSELLRYDVLTGKRKMVRKFGKLGLSAIIRLPEKIIKHYKIKMGDFAVFEERSEGILIRPVHVK